MHVKHKFCSFFFSILTLAMEGITEHAPWHELKNWKAQAAACICHWLSFTIIFLLSKKRSYKARFKARQKGNTNLRGPTADQLIVRRVYRVTCNSFCLFANKWTLAAISVQILYFPRVVYASNKWSSTRPLFERSRSQLSNTWSFHRTRVGVGCDTCHSF